MTRIVLDSSAVLAMVYEEPGGAKVRAAILSPLYVVAISAINWCEVLTKLGQKLPTITAEKLDAILPGVEVVPFGRSEAEQAASLARSCSHISMGDRACLALARSLDSTAWTTDRIWAQITVDAKVKVIR